MAADEAARVVPVADRPGPVLGAEGGVEGLLGFEMVIDELAGEVTVGPDKPQPGEDGAIRAGRFQVQHVDQIEERAAVRAEVPGQQRHVVVGVVGGDLGVLG